MERKKKTWTNFGRIKTRIKILFISIVVSRLFGHSSKSRWIRKWTLIDFKTETQGSKWPVGTTELTTFPFTLRVQHLSSFLTSTRSLPFSHSIHLEENERKTVFIFHRKTSRQPPLECGRWTRENRRRTSSPPPPASSNSGSYECVQLVYRRNRYSLSVHYTTGEKNIYKKERTSTTFTR